MTDAHTPDDKHRHILLPVLFLVSAAAPLFAWITFTFTPDMPRWQDFARFFSLPVMAIELLVVLCAAAAGVPLFRQLDDAPRWVKPALLIVTLIAIGTMVFADRAKLHTNIRTFAWIIHILFGFAIAGLAKPLWQRFGAHVWTWLIGGLLAFTLGLILFVAAMPDPVHFWWTSFWYGVINIRQLGFYSGTGFALAMGVAIATGENRTRWLATAAAAILLAISFWSGTRSSLAGIALTLVLMLAISREARRPTALIALAVALAGGYGLAKLHHPPTAFAGTDRISSDSQRKDANSTGSGRVQMWQTTAHDILKRPLFGYGESQFKTESSASLGIVNHPHNAVLQIAFQWGIIGALAFFSLYFAAWWRVAMIAREAPMLGLPGFLVIGSMFGMALLEGSLYHPWPVMMQVFVIALALGVARLAPVLPQS